MYACKVYFEIWSATVDQREVIRGYMTSWCALDDA